jgi:4-amino-4-deoxy-L-arabinose transferase-like glycosyltransferase
MAIIVTEPVHHHHGTIGTRGVYMRTNRAAIKIIEIIIGIILCALLCGPWYGRPFWDHGCFAHDGRLGFCSGLNFIILIINIIVLVLNLINRYTIYHAVNGMTTFCVLI